MSTLPRMSAPIGRLRINSSERRERRPSGVGRWRSGEPPREAEMTEAEEPLGQSTHPAFYPFPLRDRDEGDR